MNSNEARLNPNPAMPTQERRSFLWKMGAAVSAVFASRIAGVAKPLTREDHLQAQKTGLAEDSDAIRQLQQSYGSYLDRGMHEEIVSLFAEDAEVHFNGGVFIGRDKGIRRLYREHFGPGKAQAAGPVHSGLLTTPQQQDAVEVAPGGQSAKARFHRLVQASIRDTTEYPMMHLARQQGRDILQWWEDGVFENSYVKAGGVWKIETLSYIPQGQADYAAAWSRARPAYVPPFSRTYPEDPAGPDRLAKA
jgi:hypothetical protein